MPSSSRRVYLDVCALCRPFDDQSQLRIRLEADAVLLIISHLRSRDLELVISPAHLAEIASIQDIGREQLQLLLKEIGINFKFDWAKARQRAEQFVRLGIGVADAAHLAFAEQSECDFVTCDDRLLKQCKRARTSIWFGTPIAFCEKESLQ